MGTVGTKKKSACLFPERWKMVDCKGWYRSLQKMETVFDGSEGSSPAFVPNLNGVNGFREGLGLLANMGCDLLTLK